MIEGEFYKHPNCTDTCIQILSYYTVTSLIAPRTAEVHVRWWRLKAGKIAYSLGAEETFIKPKNYWRTWVRL